MLHKKRTSLFAALLLLAMLCLAGCGSTDNQAYVGKWNMTGGKANGCLLYTSGIYLAPAWMWWSRSLCRQSIRFGMRRAL